MSWARQYAAAFASDLPRLRLLMRSLIFSWFLQQEDSTTFKDCGIEEKPIRIFARDEGRDRIL